jgi:CIC family chloride channel protein
MERQIEITLSRDLGLFDVTMIGVGAMIGAGIFVLTGIAAGAAGRTFLRQGRPALETVIAEARQWDVPVHTMIRLGRDVARAIRRTVEENASDLIVLGWPGYTQSSNRAFGRVIDEIVANPPADIAVVRYRKYRELRSILVPVAGGTNSRLAVRMAATMARQSPAGPVKVTVLRVISQEADEAEVIRAQKDLAYSIDTTPYEFDKQVVKGNDVVRAILQKAEGYDLIIIGATNEPLFRTLLIGNIPEEIARQAKVTTIMVKRGHGPIRSFLRETFARPTVVQPEPEKRQTVG